MQKEVVKEFDMPEKSYKKNYYLMSESQKIVKQRNHFFFLMGYIVHKILMCSLGRLHEDDRDHLGKKRLDLAGPLMASLFRFLFKKLVKEARKYLQKCLNEGRDFNIIYAFKSKTLSDGLKYSLATGNWGDKINAARAGVSQVKKSILILSELQKCKSFYIYSDVLDSLYIDTMVNKVIVLIQNHFIYSDKYLKENFV